MKINPSTLTVQQLFSGANEQFLVPAYQRRFAWKYRQLAELFDDIDMLGESEAHLLGTVLFLTHAHRAGINSVELIDGQQRITSIAVLFKSIQDRLTELGDNDGAQEFEALLTCKG